MRRQVTTGLSQPSCVFPWPSSQDGGCPAPGPRRCVRLTSSKPLVLPNSGTRRTMHFQQFYLGCLAHASYLLGSEGVAAGGDPQPDVEGYVEEAARAQLEIAYVIANDLHARFASVQRGLGSRTGA